MGEARRLDSDTRFATPAGRRQHDAELATLLSHTFTTRSAEEWETELRPRNVGCVAVNQEPAWNFSLSHPTMLENGFLTEVEHPRFGRHQRHGPITTLSMTPGAAGPGCLMGQHTRSILSEFGYPAQEIERLHARGVVSWPPD